MIEHVSLRVGDPSVSSRFYARALGPLGYSLSKRYGDAFGFIQGGRHDFWVTGGEVGTPNHVAFHAADEKSVDAFYKAALAAGAEDNGPPGMRRGYGYAAFVHDPDGHNVEAVVWKAELAKPKRKPKSKASSARRPKRKGRSARPA